MIYTVDKIIMDARIAMDLGCAHQSIIAEGEDSALTIDQRIRAVIVKAVRQVHSEAPPCDLCGGHHLDDAIYWDSRDRGSCAGHLLLPDDYMRLLSLRMSDWSQPCTEVIEGDTPAYRRQHSRWRALRGHPERPVCAVVRRPEGLALEFFSCRSTSATVVEALYMPFPSIDSDGGIDIAPRCYDAVIQRIIDLLNS